MVSLAKQAMRQRPTYETLVRDTILNPRDKINLPNRTATLLRSTQKLNQFDDESFLDLDEENKRIAAERMQQMEFTRLVKDSKDKDIQTEKASQDPRSDDSTGPTTQYGGSSSSYGRAPPSPKQRSHNPWATHVGPKLQTHFNKQTSDTTLPTPHGKPTVYSPGKGIHTATQPQPEIPSKFDHTIDEDVKTTGEKIKKELDQRENVKRMKRTQIAEAATDDLDMADNTYVAKMAKGKKKKDKGLKYEETARSIKLKIDKYGDKLAGDSAPKNVSTGKKKLHKKGKGKVEKEETKVEEAPPTSYSMKTDQMTGNKVRLERPKAAPKTAPKAAPKAEPKAAPKAAPEQKFPSRVNIQNCREILLHAVNKNEIRGPLAAEIRQLENELVDKSGYTGPRRSRREITRRLQEIYQEVRMRLKS